MTKEQKNNQIAKHTPGPWSVAINEDGSIETGRCFADQTTSIFSESGFGSVAAVIYKKSNILGDSKTLEEQTFKANALLIAAAPELLEALQMALPYLQDLENENFEDRNYGIFYDNKLATALSKAKLSITKATGGTL
jgi:hypothetical protein